MYLQSLFAFSVFAGWLAGCSIGYGLYCLVVDWLEWTRLQKRLDYYVGGAACGGF
jgi:hypothetical protein